MYEIPLCMVTMVTWLHVFIQLWTLTPATDMLHNNSTHCIDDKGELKLINNKKKIAPDFYKTWKCCVWLYTIIISEVRYKSVKLWQWQPLVPFAVALSVHCTSPSAAEWRIINQYSSNSFQDILACHMGPIAWKMCFVSRTWAIWLPTAKYKLWNQVFSMSNCMIPGFLSWVGGAWEQGIMHK